MSVVEEKPKRVRTGKNSGVHQGDHWGCLRERWEYCGKGGQGISTWEENDTGLRQPLGESLAIRTAGMYGCVCAACLVVCGGGYFSLVYFLPLMSTSPNTSYFLKKRNSGRKGDLPSSCHGAQAEPLLFQGQAGDI